MNADPKRTPQVLDAHPACRWRAAITALIALVLAATTASTAPGAELPNARPDQPRHAATEAVATGRTTQNDGGRYQVSKFELSYERKHPDHPPIEQFLHMPIVLGKTAEGYVVPRLGAPPVTIRLADFKGPEAHTFFASAIKRINERIVTAFNRKGVVGIFVAPHRDDLDRRTGEDRRRASNTVLRLVVSAVAPPVGTSGPELEAPAPAAFEARPVGPAAGKAEAPKPSAAKPAAAKAPQPVAAASKAPQPVAAATKAPQLAAAAPEATKPTTAATRPAVAATRPAKPAPISDGTGYNVSKFELSYGRKHPDHPPIEQFMQVPIVLGKMAKGYVVPRPGVQSVTIRLADFKGPEASVFFASAIKRINERIVAALNRKGIVGIFVAPHEEDLDAKGGPDKRKGKTVLRLVVWSAVVSRVRTLGAGERLPSADRLDNPAHARIRERSPLKAKDLLNKDRLDDYVFFLSRHPGRRVDVAVTSGEKSGEVALDYLVSENKPWLAYAQTSNTGTEATSKWRHRFGFIYNQFTGNDDIASGEYTTSGFDEPEAQSASGSYEAPFFGMDRLRWRAYGSWAQYEASVKSGGTFGQNYTGYEWRIGGEMIANVFQKKQTFLDLVGGVTWRRIHVDNESMPGQTGVGDADLFVPHVGLRVERITDLASTLGSVTVEFNCQGIANSDEEDYARLGRTSPDGDWVLLSWDLLQSFFLEPLVNRAAWRDASSPETSTLAHELAFQFRGQYAMNGYRMIPQGERVVGGFFTVRGYPESTIAGDTALIGTAEYRLHVPRLFKLQDDPTKTPLPLVGTPFRWAPQTVYGRPDWDLIVRTFFDIGRATNVDRLSFEEDYTLIGAGVGVEIQFTRHINVRCDWGIPCRDMDSASQTVQAGDHRFYFVATVLY